MYNMRNILIAISLIFIFISCTTTKEIEYKDIYKDRIVSKVDTFTLLQKDSIYINQYQKGDTIYKEKECWKIRYKDRIVLRTDTIIDKQIEYKDKVATKEIIPNWCYKLLWFNLACVIMFVVYLCIKNKIK